MENLSVDVQLLQKKPPVLTLFPIDRVPAAQPSLATLQHTVSLATPAVFFSLKIQSTFHTAL